MAKSRGVTVHQEFPMFSNRTRCGRRRTKGMHYAWGDLKLVTCKDCLRGALLEQHRLAVANHGQGS
jgi:hypothetical protein